MARESKAAKAARIQQDNLTAARLPLGMEVETTFGSTVLGANQGPSDISEGWDIYTVQHSGFNHNWSSALVVATFTTTEKSQS